MRTLAQFVLGLALAACALATTLQHLTLDDMVQKSTAIVHGTVAGSSCVQRNGMFYTVYRLQVTEWVKGSGSTTAEVYVPGGTLNGYRQVVPGAPTLTTGAEYVVFIWTSPKGLPHLVGMSQGLLAVTAGTSTDGMLSRGPVEDAQVLDSQGKPVADTGLKVALSALRAKARQPEAR